MANTTKLLLRWKEVLFITASIKLLLLILPIILNLPEEKLFQSWVRWDGPHYIDIAKNWYQTQGTEALWIVFYPLYPLLIKIFNLLINNFSASSIAVSIVFSFSSSILLFELTLLDFNKKIALLAVWFLNIFPTAYFLQASYTESLYLTVSLATIYFYRQKKYLVSSVGAILSTMTRINGLLLLPLLIIENRQIRKNLSTIFLLPVGFLMYLLINYFSFGDFFYFTKPLVSNWYKQFEWPWVGIKNLMIYANSQSGDYYYLFWGEIVSIMIILFLTLFTFLKIRKSYGIYMFLNLILFTSTGFILSTPRYMLSLFPIYICLGLIKNKLLLSLVSLILLFILSSFYIQGKWAY